MPRSTMASISDIVIRPGRGESHDLPLGTGADHKEIRGCAAHFNTLSFFIKPFDCAQSVPRTVSDRNAMESCELRVSALEGIAQRVDQPAGRQIERVEVDPHRTVVGNVECPGGSGHSWRFNEPQGHSTRATARPGHVS